MGVCGQSTQTGLVLASGFREMEQRAGNDLTSFSVVLILLTTKPQGIVKSSSTCVLVFETTFVCVKYKTQIFLGTRMTILWLWMTTEWNDISVLLFRFLLTSEESWSSCCSWRSWGQRAYQRLFSRLLLLFWLLSFVDEVVKMWWSLIEMDCSTVVHVETEFRLEIMIFQQELHQAFLEAQSELKAPDGSRTTEAAVESCLRTLLEKKKPRLAQSLSHFLQVE